MNNRKLLQKGFTMIEILVVAGILVFLGLGILAIQGIIGTSQSDALSNFINTDEADSAVTGFVREMRSARQSETGSYPLEIVNDQEIAFYTDYDFDGDVERIRYFLDANILNKGVIEPTLVPDYPTENEVVKELSENVQNGINPVFYYYNQDWPNDTVNNPLAVGSRISDTVSIKIIVSVNENPELSPINYVAESHVQLRSLKDNL